MKKVAIFGGSGFIGTALKESLQKEEWTVLPFQRKSAELPYFWDPMHGILDMKGLEDCPYIVNLSGESIIGFWSKKKKEAILASRVQSARLIGERLGGKERVLIQASAVGFYGDRGDELLDEGSPMGENFLARVASVWEKEALSFQSRGGRVAILRMGTVLDKRGGALSKMMLPFRFGVGGRFGSGKQWMSWIALEDLIKALSFLIHRETAVGVYNAVSPNSVTNQEFTEELAKALGRPHFFSVPAVLLKTLLPEMAEELFLSSLRVVPKKLQEEGFSFSYPVLFPYLEKLLGK